MDGVGLYYNPQCHAKECCPFLNQILRKHSFFLFSFTMHINWSWPNTKYLKVKYPRCDGYKLGKGKVVNRLKYQLVWKNTI